MPPTPRRLGTRQRYRDQLIATLESRWGLTDLSKRIVVERRITPLDLQTLYNANAGTIYGIGSNTLKTAFLRPPNRDRDALQARAASTSSGKRNATAYKP